MAMASSSSTDLDMAYKLQLEEALTDSLLQPKIGKADSLSIDPETLELLYKYEQEQQDSFKSQDEMNRLRHDLKRRIHDQNFVHEIHRIPDNQWRENGDNLQKPFVEAGASTLLGFDNSEPFRLYFKGSFSYEKFGAVAGIGAAVCDPKGNLILNIQKPLVGDWRSDWAVEDLQMKVELKALVEGLNAAIALDIKKIDCYCDYYPLHQNITMRWLLRQQKIATVVDQVLLLQRRFARCNTILVPRKDVKFAFKLARDAIDSQISRLAESSNGRSKKESCSICLEDIDAGRMFSVDGCSHRYCVCCMKQHIEVKLLDGVVPGCPHEGCNIGLSLSSCRKFLSAELIDKMSQRIAEASIPVTDKVYCPYPRCSVLMSKAEILPYTGTAFIRADPSAVRKCSKCYHLFCINCKVPWHHNLSCRDYQRLNPGSNTEDAKLKSLARTREWRQCIKCNHMIELVEGCYHMTCRCGYEFCYTCGAEWRNKKAACRCPIWDETNIVRDRQRRRVR